MGVYVGKCFRIRILNERPAHMPMSLPLRATLAIAICVVDAAGIANLPYDPLLAKSPPCPHAVMVTPGAAVIFSPSNFPLSTG